MKLVSLDMNVQLEMFLLRNLVCVCVCARARARVYECVFRSFWTGLLERELQMV
jgi:hypothetical protein